jgi:hypothetical protein
VRCTNKSCLSFFLDNRVNAARQEESVILGACSAFDFAVAAVAAAVTAAAAATFAATDEFISPPELGYCGCFLLFFLACSMRSVW